MLSKPYETIEYSSCCNPYTLSLQLVQSLLYSGAIAICQLSSGRSFELMLLFYFLCCCTPSFSCPVQIWVDHLNGFIFCSK